MTKNKVFSEIKLAMRAGHYRDLTFKEKKIYKNAFKNGYKLAKIHCKKRSPEFYSQEELLAIHLPNLVQELLTVLLIEFVFVMKYTKKV